MKRYSYAFHQGFLVSETVKVGKNRDFVEIDFLESPPQSLLDI